MSIANLRGIYAERFSRTGLDKRRRVWKVLCHDFFDDHIPPNATVLDLACGYGEFINQVRAKRKLAIDLNPDAARFLSNDVTYYCKPATDLSDIADGSVHAVFTSNFLEHLRDKSECDRVFSSVLKALQPGGRFIILGPNIKYAYREYWDYYDHYLPLSHLSLAEGLAQSGYQVRKVIPRFLPYTMNSNMPTPDLFIRAYLRLPVAWRVLGKQFLVIAEKPEDNRQVFSPRL
jgi:SAM-dependent methyltransferase